MRLVELFRLESELVIRLVLDGSDESVCDIISKVPEVSKQSFTLPEWWGETTKQSDVSCCTYVWP